MLVMEYCFRRPSRLTNLYDPIADLGVRFGDVEQAWVVPDRVSVALAMHVMAYPGMPDDQAGKRLARIAARGREAVLLGIGTRCVPIVATAGKFEVAGWPQDCWAALHMVQGGVLETLETRQYPVPLVVDGGLFAKKEN